MKKLASLILALAMICFTLAGCQPKQNTDEPTSDQPNETQALEDTAEPIVEATDANEVNDDETIVMAISSAWSNLYPYEINGTYEEILNILIFDRLMDVSQQGDLIPRLVSDVQISDDSKTFICTLNPKATWHDGEAVTADDVVWSFQIMTNPDLYASRRYLMNIFEGTDDEGVQTADKSVGVTKIDNNTIEMKFKLPSDPTTVFNTLKQFVVLPQHLLKDIPLAELHTNEFWQHPIGSGPYMFVSQVEGERIELDKNPNYELGPIDIEHLVIRVVPSASMVSGLLSGEIDMNVGSIGKIQPVDVATLQEDENLVVESIPSFDFQYMCINHNRDYLTKDIRRAMNMAINKQLIVDQLLYGYAVVMHSVWPESHPYYADLNWDGYDPEAARKIVEESGWDTNRELVMYVPTGNTVREQSAVIIQQNLADVGIKVRIQSADFATVMAACYNDETDLALIGSSGSIEPNEVSTQFIPGATTNFSNVTSEYYELFQEGLKYTTFEERYPYYKQFQELFCENTPYITLYSPNMIEVYNKHISGLNPQNFCQTTYEVWNWKLD